MYLTKQVFRIISNPLTIEVWSIAQVYHNHPDLHNYQRALNHWEILKSLRIPQSFKMPLITRLHTCNYWKFFWEVLNHSNRHQFCLQLLKNPQLLKSLFNYWETFDCWEALNHSALFNHWESFKLLNCPQLLKTLLFQELGFLRIIRILQIIRALWITCTSVNH